MFTYLACSSCFCKGAATTEKEREKKRTQLKYPFKICNPLHFKMFYYILCAYIHVFVNVFI